MTGLRKTKFLRVFYRPNLLLGGERGLVLYSAFASGTLTLTSMNLIAGILALAIWIGSLWALRKMAKSDALMSKVYLRQTRYRAYYPARSRSTRTV